MKYVKGITLAVMTLFVIAAFVVPASAERDSLKVILLTEESTYKTGDNVTVEARVYDGAELVDADTILVYLDTTWGGSESEITMEQVSTGIYRGTYEVEQEDHYLEFTCYAEVGSDSDGNSRYASIYEEHLELGIHFSHQNTAYLWPGDSVIATLMTQYRDEPVDIDEFTYLRLVDSEETETELEYERKSEGVYQVEITVDEVTENMEYSLQARALYANAHASAQADIIVNVLTVWYKLETHAGHTATFSMGVADSKGKGVSDAEINIEYPQTLKETTDEDGLALISLTNVHNGATVRGYVESEELVQSFQGQIYWEEADEVPAPSHTGFDVVYDGDTYIYSSGSKVTRSYRAYNSSIPLSNADIYYYVTLESSDFFIGYGGYEPNGWDYPQTSKVIKTGVVTTSILGEFTVSYTAPSKQGLVYIWFETGIILHDGNYNPYYWSEYDYDDDLVYEEDTDGMFISKGNMWDSGDITIETNPLKVGGKTKVTVKTSDSLSNEDMIVAMWMVGEPENVQSIFDSESIWSCWVDGGEMIFLKEKDDSKVFEGHSIIPDFMSDEDDYTIVAGSVEGDTGFPSANHATLKEGERAGDQNMELLVLILLGGAVLVILTILAFGAFTDNKNMSKPGDESPQVPPPGGSSPPSSGVHTQQQTELAPDTAKLSSVPMVNLEHPEGEPVTPEEQVPKAENAREGADK
jgi:hypothetical protein